MRYQSLIHGHLADFGIKFLKPRGKFPLLPIAAIVIRAVAFDMVDKKSERTFMPLSFSFFSFGKVLFDGLAELAFQALIIHAARFLRQFHHRAVLKLDIFIPGSALILVIR